MKDPKKDKYFGGCIKFSKNTDIEIVQQIATRTNRGNNNG